MSAEQNKMSIRRWVEVAWNNGNLAVADEVYSSDYLLHDPAGPIHGTEPSSNSSPHSDSLSGHSCHD